MTYSQYLIQHRKAVLRRHKKQEKLESKSVFYNNGWHYRPSGEPESKWVSKLEMKRLFEECRNFKP